MATSTPTIAREGGSGSRLQNDSGGERSMINARQLARLRRRVIRGYLHGLGYELSNKEYPAHVGPQLRYVSFGRAKYGHSFDVSITLHFDFLSPFTFGYWLGTLVPNEMCADLCAFNRLVRSRSGRQYYEYGETEAEAEEMLHDIAVRAAAGLDEIGSTCGDGQNLLDLVSPQLLWDDLQVFRDLLDADAIEEQARLSKCMRTRQLLMGVQRDSRRAIACARGGTGAVARQKAATLGCRRNAVLH
jgi:hypothetical protein